MKDKINGTVAALVTAALVGGFAWVQEIGTRLALVEDDLGETVDVIALLHPPQRASAERASEAFHTGDAHQQRRSKLERLREQCEVPPERQGDDDDSAAQPLNS